MASTGHSTPGLLRVVTGVTILAFALSSLAGCSLGASDAGSAREYWPTEAWRTTTPEAVGIDSAKLADALLAIRDKVKLHSLLLVRNGDVVVDAYFYPYDGGSPHDLASVTKSIMTTLIGIAIDQGKLKIDDPILKFFPDVELANRSSALEKVTVRDLAMMANGLESTGYAHDEATLTQMENSGNWVQFALDRKVVAEPGKQFVYDSPGIHLLSAILQRATGMTALDFAEKNLFEPLGITDVTWPADPQGVTQGFTNIVMHPRDAAKIGYLFLNNGRWDGKQIVSQKWVQEATKRQVDIESDVGYGYGWRVIPGETGEYYALGRGGQYIRALPAFDTLVVATATAADWDEFMPYIAATLVDPEKPLPANPAGVEKLAAALKAIQQPPSAQPVAPVPEALQAISGQTFALDPNPFGLATVRLDFDDSSEAVIRLAFADGRPPWTAPVGLDGVYRLSPGENGLPAAYRGRWDGEDTFVIVLDTLGNRESFELRLQFTGDGLAFSGRELTHEQGFTVEGRRVE